MKAEIILVDPPNRVHGLEGLYRVALAKRSVFCPKLSCWKKAIPAAFIMNLQGNVLRQLFESGMYLYEPKTTKKQKNETPLF